MQKDTHKTKSMASYKKLLPLKLTVQINKSDDGGLWAKINELPNCYTQADDFPELIEMINDAVYLYFDIPAGHKSKLGYYIPKELIDEVKRQQWQKLVKEMLLEKNKKEISKTFTLSGV